MRAIETFDLNRGTEFVTYAMPWIKQKMQRYWMDNKSAVRIPIYLQEVQRLYTKLKSENEEADDEFFVRLIGKLKGIQPQTVLWAIKLHENRGNLVSTIHQINEEGEEFNLADIVAETPEIQENVNFQKLLDCLEYREKFILMKRAENYSLELISLELGISRERVRQVQEIALRKIKAMIRSKDKDYLYD